MVLGEKIKKHRQEARLTQADLAGTFMTRNMISAIESGKATPSIAALEYIAGRLELSVAYLISNDDDLFFYKKKERIQAIKNALEQKNYSVCINLILKLNKLDDELFFILASCYFELGIKGVINGQMQSSQKYLELALQYCEKTMYDTRIIETVAPLYIAIATNVTAPLLEFNEKNFYIGLVDSMHFEFFKYVTLDMEYHFTYHPYADHMKAKKLIRDRRYKEAIDVLLQIENSKNEYGYNSYLLYGVYTDLDNCYKQLFEFEKAYRYSSKRISLLEGFKT